MSRRLDGHPTRRSVWPLVAYGGLVVGAAGAFVLVRGIGETLVAREPAKSVEAGHQAVVAGPQAQVLLHLLLALVLIILAARGVGALFRIIKQPPVIGEVTAGLLLGPSLLGRLWPEASAYLLPPSVAPYLGVLSQVGVILYMFLVGLELDVGSLRHRARATIAIAHAGMALPFVLGVALSLVLYPSFSSSDVRFTVFALFIGTSLSVTAFPVLARIITDRGMQRSRLGILALTSAAIADATAWCLLAVVASIAVSRVENGVRTTLLVIAYVTIMLVVVRPLVVKFARRPVADGLTQTAVAFTFIALLLSALVTEYIGIHAIFGAFLMGALIPPDCALARGMNERLEDIVAVLLLPAFFAFTGLRTQIGLVSGADQWLVCGLIMVVASVGKFGGTTIAARLSGLDWRESASLGVLMNTRGLMELIVLNLGLDLHIISPNIFAMMVLMALVTTMATAPLLSLLSPPRVAVGAEPRPDAVLGSN